MRFPRLPIASLMFLIALVAIEIAALKQATESWCNAARYLTVGALIVASVLARHRRGAEGAWWFGFALFGWAYYVLGLDALPHGDGPVQPRSFVGCTPRWILEALHQPGEELDVESLKNLKMLSYQYRIAQAIKILLVACAGGFVSWLLARRRPSEHAQRA